MTDKYILEDRNPVKVDNLLTWGRWMETEDRIVEKSTIGTIIVSTVFLGIDHSFGGTEPLLFETMIFGGKNDGYQERYSTWDEAVKGHSKTIKLVKSSLTSHPKAKTVKLARTPSR